jgi:release factor glutamine methyltransferase|tara:strand:- start:1138 stop:1665 length:528 start_codon:yes stop_codon:yes gene_type:complete
MIYEPREDSFLLQKQVKKLAKGKVLEIGTGSGIQAVTASENKAVTEVLAVDIQEEVIDHCLRTITNKKITFQESDLFSTVEGKFDTIIFNPPYLPNDPSVADLTLDGGKEGYEIVEKFLNQVKKYLNKEGIILLLFSSLTKKEKVDELIKKNKLKTKLLSQKHIFFEDLFVYEIK